MDQYRSREFCDLETIWLKGTSVGHIAEIEEGYMLFNYRKSKHLNLH